MTIVKKNPLVSGAALGLFLCGFFLGMAACASSPRKIQKQNEKDPRYQYNMGLLYLNSREADTATLDEAIRYFDRALSLNPRYFLAFNARGLAYSMKGDLQAAIQSFEKCLEINPQFSEARNNLGSIYEELGLLSQAEEQYRKALADESYPTRELPLYNLSRLYFTQDKKEDALAFVDRAIQMNNRMAMAYNLKGLILEKLGRREEALTCFEQAVRLVGDDMNFQFNLASALFYAGERKRAEDIFSRILASPVEEGLKEKAREFLKRIRE